MLLVSLGLFISGIGTALFYKAGMGSSPLATLGDGIHQKFGISYGTANLLCNVAMLLLLVLFGRKYIHIATVLATLTLGYYINFGTRLLSFVSIPTTAYGIRFSFVLAGTLCMGIGLGYYTTLGLGMGPLEGIVEILKAKLNWSYRVTRTVSDAVFTLLGILLGGKWGIGTVVAIVATGFIMQETMRIVNESREKRKISS